MKVDSVWPYQHESSLIGIVGNMVAPLYQTIQIRIYPLYNLQVSPFFLNIVYYFCLLFLRFVKFSWSFPWPYLSVFILILSIIFFNFQETFIILWLFHSIVFLLCGSSVFLPYLRTLIIILFSLNFWIAFNPSFLFLFSPDVICIC